MKKFTIKALATSLSAIITATATTQVQASDIEIYTVPDKAQKTIVMMLDTSFSMYACDTRVTLNNMDVKEDDVLRVKSHTYGNFYTYHSGNAHWNTSESNKTKIRAYVGSEKSTTTPQYDRNFCYGQNSNLERTNVKHYDRITKLKDAVFALMDSNQLDDSIHVAVGHFTFDGTRGMIQIPAAPLTQAHRRKIKEYIAGVLASGQTPTAAAYADAAAYMMGTNTIATSLPPIEVEEYTRQLWVEHPVNSKEFFYCGRKDGGSGSSLLTDALKDLNVDNTGACTGIWGSTQTKMTEREALRQGFKIQDCRGNSGNGGFVYSNSGDIKTRCLYKDNDKVTITFGMTNEQYNQDYSGFARSHESTKQADGRNYKSPLPTTGRECSGQSIYFLTDGYPNRANGSQHLMRAALGNKAGDFPIPSATFDDETKYLDSTNEEGMAQAGELAKRLRDPARNPAGVVVKTALIGFGADFAAAKSAKTTLTDEKGKSREYYDCSQISRREIKNACNFGEKSHKDLRNVGGYGEGGFFYAEDAQDVVKSFLEVANDIEIKFDSITTGAPTIPVNSLNRQKFLPEAYYASFVPKPAESQQLWTGNMNKYVVRNDVLNGKGEKPLFTNGLINADVLGMWDRDVEEAGTIKTLKGVHGNLKLRTDVQNNTQRKVYTESAGNARALTQVTVQALNTGALRNSSAKNHWLNLLGYDVPENEVVNFNRLSEKAELRQLGATMHSSPLVLTQSGKVFVDTENKLKESNRDDYVVYGSTQGVLHIVDADTGEEKFAFVPQKMVEKQKQAFLKETVTKGGKENLFYGVDGPWVAHTEYVVRADGALTVGSANPSDVNAPKGKQWIYGGLRMGGKNYYSLDLSSIANTATCAKDEVNDQDNSKYNECRRLGQMTGSPVLKFNIDPEETTVYSGTGRRVYSELSHMGQSWSKPALGYIRWNGQRRLVMFVGGGYDEGYETSDYQQDNGVGAGVYMFDAETGDLLWWASNNTVTTQTGGVVKHNATDDDVNSLKYSVVSRINTIDRDSDGLIDALYFGDLAGQGFRIDLNNDNRRASGNTPAVPFSVRVVKLFDEHKKDGTSPRFYEMPSVSIQKAKDGSRFMVAAFGSGDRSSPLAGARKDSYGNDITKNANTADDMTLVVYDYDVGNSAWKTLTFNSLKTHHLKGALKPAVLNSNNKANEVVADGENQGWKYTFIGSGDRKGRYKTFGEPSTLISLLRINTYDREGGNLGSECGGGVIGASRAYQFCLPTGICREEEHGYVRNEDTPITSQEAMPGLVGIETGANKDGQLINIMNSKSPNINSDEASKQKCGEGAMECIAADAPSTIAQLRWYESRQSKKEGSNP